MLRTSASPIPSPPARRVVEVSACVKRSKTCGKNSGAMPWPLSLTASCTRLACEPDLGADDAALGGELDRVRQQVRHELLQAARVAVHRHHRVDRTSAQSSIRFAAAAGARDLERRVHHLDQIERWRSSVSLPLMMREVSSRSSISRAWCVDVALDRLGGALDQPGIERPRGGEQVAPAAQRVERRAQLVRHDREELVLRAVGALGLAPQSLLGRPPASRARAARACAR